jgi:uncharacterized delta-60 repeat protein
MLNKGHSAMNKNILLYFVTFLHVNLAFCQIYPFDHSITNIYGVHESEFNSIVVQPDGKAIALGWSVNEWVKEAVIIRYNADGSLDSDFGFDGILLTGFHGEDAIGHSLAIQTDGKIIMAGRLRFVMNGTWSYMVMVVRYLEDGTPDHSFGTNGHVFVEPIAYEKYGHVAVDLQDDGKIITSVAMLNLVDQGFVMFRFNANGTLDDSFGTNGKVKTDFGFVNGASAMALKCQDDGKIVVAGGNSITGITARYLTDGTLDTGFGDNGITLEDHFHWRSVLIQPDGKMVVGGSAIDTLIWYVNFALARYNEDGSLDASFGADGRVMTGLPQNNIYGNCLITREDEKFILAGSSYGGGSVTVNDDFDVVLAGYHSDGSLDNSFATDGIAVLDAGSAADVANSVAAGSNDRLFLGGYVHVNSNMNRNVVMGLNAGGAFDTTFSSNGISTIQESSVDFASTFTSVNDLQMLAAGSADGTLSMVKYNNVEELDYLYGRNGIVKTKIKGRANSIVSQPSNKVIITTDSLLCRFSDSGSPDFAFGVDGVIAIDSVTLVESVVQPDGKIVVAGNKTLPESKFTVLRFNSDGTPDLEFGMDGMTFTDFGNNGDHVYSCALQQDGKIILAGNTKINDSFTTPDDYDFAIARYNPDGTPDSTFGLNGKVITTLSSSVDHCSSIALQPDGKMLCTGMSDSALALIRYDSNGELDAAFGSGGTFISSDIAQFGNKVLVQQDNKVLVLADRQRMLRFMPNGSIDETFIITQLLPGPGPNEGLYDAFVQSDGSIALAGTMDEDFLLMEIPASGYTGTDEHKKNPFGFMVSPNPAHNALNITFELKTPECISIVLRDMIGRTIKVIKTDEFMMTGVHNEHILLDTQLPHGVYFLQLHSPHSSQSVKIIKK